MRAYKILLTDPRWSTETGVDSVRIGFTEEEDGTYVPTLVCNAGRGPALKRTITPEGLTYSEAWEKIIEHIEFHRDGPATAEERRSRPAYRDWELLVIEMQNTGIPITDEATLPLYDAFR